VGQICCVIVGILLNITGNFNKAIIDCLEKIQLRFCKLLLKLKSSTPKYMIYGDLGRFSIGIDIKNKDCVILGQMFLGKETNFRTYHINLYTRFLLKKMFISSGLNIQKNFSMKQATLVFG
jgi:hypothetical protein